MGARPVASRLAIVAALATTPVVVAGCAVAGVTGGPTAPEPHWVDLPDADAFPPARPRSEEETVALQAAADFGCGAGSVVARREGPDRQGRVLVAEGCGRRAVYLQLIWEEAWTQGSGAWVVRFVRLGEGWRARVDALLAGRGRRLAARHSPPELQREPRFEVTSLVERFDALQAQGAHDLHCPRERTVPGVDDPQMHDWPIAEGCGRRAVYLPWGPPFKARRIHAEGDRTSDEPGGETCP
jgi:hypothetical protein